MGEGKAHPNSLLHRISVSLCLGIGDTMQKNTDKKKTKCKNCEGKGLVKLGDKKVKCQRCGGTGYKSATSNPGY